MTPSRIFLIGPMGAGKSTVGKQLALQLNYNFFDCDREIETAAGTNIPTIFEFEGEAGFRLRETRMLNKLCTQEQVVVATGGGAILSEENRALLKTHGTIIYLRISLDEQWQRTSQDKNRPLLQTADPKAKLHSLAQQRTPLYESIADLHIDTDGQTVRAVVEQLVHMLPGYNQPSGS